MKTSTSIIKPTPIPNGFTLIEILVAMTVSLFILVTTTQLLLSQIRNQQSSSVLATLQKTHENIVSDIFTHTRWAKQVSFSPSQIVIVDWQGEIIKYESVDNNVIKTLPDGQQGQLNPDNTSITEFIVTPLPESESTGINIQIEIQHQEQPEVLINSNNPVTLRFGAVYPL